MCAYPSSKYASPHCKCVFVVVRNFHGLIFQVENHISIIKMLSPPYIIMSINTLYVVLCMADALSMKIKSVNCVIRLQMQLLLKNFTQEKNSSWWSRQLWTFVKTYIFLKWRQFISPTTCTHSWAITLWQYA